jgi:hypothetical protein
MKGRIYRNRLQTGTQVKIVWEPLSYISALLLVTVFVRFFVCVCACARACVRVCPLHKVIYLFIQCLNVSFLCFLRFSCYFLFKISSFRVLAFICFFVRFSFSWTLSLFSCVVFLHIRSCTPLNRSQNSGTSRWTYTWAAVSRWTVRSAVLTSMALPWRIHCQLSCCSLFRQCLLGYHSVSRPYC